MRDPPVQETPSIPCSDGEALFILVWTLSQSVLGHSPTNTMGRMRTLLEARKALSNSRDWSGVVPRAGQSVAGHVIWAAALTTTLRKAKYPSC